jgi:hypothetical protein
LPILNKSSNGRTKYNFFKNTFTVINYIMIKRHPLKTIKLILI